MFKKLIAGSMALSLAGLLALPSFAQSHSGFSDGLYVAPERHQFFTKERRQTTPSQQTNYQNNNTYYSNAATQPRTTTASSTPAYSAAPRTSNATYKLQANPYIRKTPATSQASSYQSTSQHAPSYRSYQSQPTRTPAYTNKTPQYSSANPYQPNYTPSRTTTPRYATGTATIGSNTGYSTYNTQPQTNYKPTGNYYNNTSNDDIALRGHLATIPKGTIVTIQMDQPVSSFSSRVGDPVNAVVEADVQINNRVVIPAGSAVLGTVTGVKTAGRLSKHAAIEMQFNLIKTPQGNNIPFRGYLVTSDHTGIVRADSKESQVIRTAGAAAGITGASTLMGTAAGALLSSTGPGAVFGLAAGGIAGIAYAITREGKQVTIPRGARMNVVIADPVAMH